MICVVLCMTSCCRLLQQSKGRVSSRNFILGGGGGGKLTDHVAVRPRREEGRLHNYNYWQISWGGGEVGSGKLSCLGRGGGELPLRPPP